MKYESSISERSIESSSEVQGASSNNEGAWDSPSDEGESNVEIPDEEDYCFTE